MRHLVGIAQQVALGSLREVAELFVEQAHVFLVLAGEDVLYVGDSGVDSLTAECAGMDCLLVSWGFRPREELEQLTCMTIIDKAEEIMYFLK